jgi:NAD(P)-dependent dehydrogenase (short-subunit alcohol dehydrogenase family)
MKLTGKKALITGGNSGIGLATARLFIAEGAQVAITGRDQRTLDAAIAELGPNARGYRADITVAEDRKQLFAALAKDFGKLDIVFANAGISGRTPTGSTDEAVFENVIHTNLNGAFYTVNSAAPLLNNNGSIIFNGSVHNYLGQPGAAAYAATKGGIVSMARSIAADFAPQHSRERRRTRRDEDSHLEARAPRLYICRRVRQAGEVLLVCHSAGPLGRARRTCQGCALPGLG